MRFPDGARVVFIGDSLVAANIALTKIREFYDSNYPESGIKFYNAGISGGTAESALRYFDVDIMRHRPTHAVLALGVNDSERWVLQEKGRSAARRERMVAAYEKYKKNLPALVDRILGEGIELTLCTPLPYDEYSEGSAPIKGGFALLLGYADFVRAFAKERGFDILDYHDYFSKLIENEAVTPFSPDHVHPTNAGYLYIAECFLAYQGFDCKMKEGTPDKLLEWDECIRRLRMVYSAEYMLIKDLSLDDAGKLSLVRDGNERGAWENTAFEPFAKAYVKDKESVQELYKRIDELT